MKQAQEDDSLMDAAPPFVSICDIPVVCLDRNQFTQFAVKDIHAKQGLPPRLCFSLNGESLAEFHGSGAFCEILGRADYIHADGMSIVNLSRHLGGSRLPERIATTDWFHDIAEEAQNSGLRFYFLGGKQKTLKAMLKHVQAAYPRLLIAGSRNGYFSKSDEESIIAEINRSKADILWVGLGRPKQEVISIAWRDRLDVGWIKTCGGLFDFLSKEKMRAPQHMQRLNLEWFYRMMLEPSRLGPRYLKTNIMSIYIASQYILKRLFSRR